MSHGFVGFSALASTIHEQYRSLQCLSPRKRSPYPAIQHMPDTSVCASLRSDTWPRWFCPLGSDTPLAIHQGSFLYTWEYSHPRLQIFFTPLRFFVSLSTDMQSQHTHSRTVRFPSHLKLALLTNGVYHLHDRKSLLCSSVCVCDVRR